MARWVGLLAWIVLPACIAYAGGMDDADYTSPNRWSQHLTSQGFIQSLEDHQAWDGTINFSVTTRYRLQSNDFSDDQDIFGYLRSDLDDVSLGKGSVSGSFFLRVAKDIDGYAGRPWGEERFYFYDDSLDADEDGDWDGRLYQGFLQFYDMVKNTDLILGRQQIDHLNRFKLDGADLALDVADERLKLFAYGGLPVSHYVDTDEDFLGGGGVDYRPTDELKLRGEYTNVDVSDQDSHLVKLRADYSYQYGTVHGQYGALDGDGFYEIGTVARYAPTQTILTVRYEELLDEIGNNEGGFPVNPLTYTLLPYGEYSKIKLMVQQGVSSHVVIGGGVELKSASGTEDLDNRDYQRYSANVDLVQLPTEDTYISFSIDYWEVDRTDEVGSESEVTFGGRISQVLNDESDVWLGTSFERFKYDFEDDVMKDWVRTYYAGGQYRFKEKYSITADLNWEDSELLDTDSDDFKMNFGAQIWLSMAL